MLLFQAPRVEARFEGGPMTDAEGARQETSEPMAKGEPELRDLTPPSVTEGAHRVDLHELGFVGFVTPEALAAIERSELRANKVLTTAATFAFR